MARYPRWLVGTESPLLALAIAAPFVLERTADSAAGIWRSTSPRWLAGLCLALATLVTAAYLFYVPFDDWWYVRFLLPAVPLLLAPATAVLVAGLSRLPAAWRVLGYAVCLFGLAGFYLRTAADREVFGLREAERRFVETGRYIGTTLPEGATVLTVWHSGSVRHYGDRLSILWDSLDPAWLDRALAHLQRAGRPPYLLFEAWEEPRFRDRFTSHSEIGALDWPPMARIGRNIRLYNPADRSRYLAGEPIRTERVWLDRRSRTRH